VKRMKWVNVDSTSNAKHLTDFCISFVFFVSFVVKQNNQSAIEALL